MKINLKRMLIILVFAIGLCVGGYMAKDMRDPQVDFLFLVWGICFGIIWRESE